MPKSSDSRSTAATSASDAAASPADDLRMRDLVRLTGLPRETIHFYLTQGLLPKPLKKGRNTAVYGAEHLDRLERIKDLQEKHFLPLRAIKAVLEESSDGGFSPEQEVMLRRVRDSLLPAKARTVAGDVALSTLVPSRVLRAEFDAMKRLGFVESKGRGADTVVSSEDARVLEGWGELREIVGPDEPAVTPELLATYEDAMATLVSREARTLTERFAGLSGERAVELIEATHPIVAKILEAFRRKKIAALLESVAPAEPPEKKPSEK